MFVKPGDSVRFLWFFQTAAGLGKTGLTVSVAVNRGTTNAVSGGSASALDATNQPGWYYYDYTVPAAYYGILAGYASTTDTSVLLRGGASLYVSAAWVELAAQLSFDGSSRVSANVTAVAGDAVSAIDEFKADVSGISTQLDTIEALVSGLDAAHVTVLSPLDALTGSLELIRGDSYRAADGRQISWASDDWTPLDLTGAAAITFKARSRYSSAVFEKAADALSDTLVRLELTSAETDAFVVGRDAYRFDLEAELAGGEIVTLAQGKLHVMEDVR